jgi:two-component system phosphate regulon response regulator OmpR
VRFGSIVVQLGTRILVRNGEETLLTTGEFALLKVLLQHPRQPLSRDRLMELARGREYDVFDRSIDVQISRLRKLIEEDPSKPRYSRPSGASATSSCPTATSTASKPPPE